MKRLFLLASLALTACGGAGTQQSVSIPDPPSPLAVKKNFYMRTVIDSDPSLYLGRFIADNLSASDIDETSAEKHECSSYFEIQKIDGAGIDYDEYYQASLQASAGLQIPVKSLNAGANSSESSLVRVQYKQGERWVANVKDPAGFRACCDSLGCPSRYIAEFIQGTGSISYAADAANNAGLSAQKVGGVDYKDGFSWKKSIQFDRPAFFAYRVGYTLGSDSASSSVNGNDWCENLPQRRDGIYFCGVSSWTDDESLARDQANYEARIQVLRYLGEKISTNSKIVQTLKEDGTTAKTGNIEIQRAVEGLSSFVKSEKYLVDEDQQPGRRVYRAKVLAFIKNSALEAAAKSSLK